MKRSQNTNAGFTLVELLSSITMTSLLIGTLGFGLVKILEGNQQSTKSSYARVELNRAADRIVEDIRSSTKIEENTFSPQDFDLPGGAETILVLKTNLDGNVGYRVYYQTSPVSNSIWQGDLVLWRWEDKNINDETSAELDVMIDQLDSVSIQQCEAGSDFCEISLARNVQIKKQSVTAQALVRAKESTPSP
jgi:type II secretory pathway pseudopilin PulG